MSVPRFQLTSDYSISQVIKGGWHLAGGHGAISANEAIADMLSFVQAGITTFDCADIYTGVEELIGQFLKHYRSQMASGELPTVQVHTKYVPDYDALATLTKQDTERIIDRSLQRLGVERLDLVQFHWWDYQFPRYIDTALHLKELQEAGKIRNIGITNFDTARVQEMVNAGVSIASNQVQYSVFDQRAANDEPEAYAPLGIPFLCYGVVAGGFLSPRWLGKTDPGEPYENRSLTKYRLIIEEFGSWGRYQEVLQALQDIGQQYGVGSGEVACRYVLQQQGIGGIIVGARNRDHLARLAGLVQFSLSPEDLALIDALIAQGNGPQGPFYALERDKTGKHGAIMKYNLNKK
ncbi:MAG TPA: aldo/keto reductase [Cytophagales bacterium]|nr:aldo/keto reductase [Cytophagales bacterium]HAP59283.1 aldo/keto reductase [Cytophagales bacterium]